MRLVKYITIKITFVREYFLIEQVMVHRNARDSMMYHSIIVLLP